MSKNIYRGVKSVFITLLLVLFIFSTAFAAGSQDLPMDKVNTLVSHKVFDGKSFPNGIIAGRYMEDDTKGGCKDATLPNWEEFPLKKCTYNQIDKNAPKKIKTATVIMLNPDKEVLAKWIIASCLIVNGNMDIDACTNKIAYKIIDASGSQFAVSGIVLEDQNSDGIQEAYIFRDGVTVCVQDGIGVCKPDGRYVPFTGMFGEKENAIALDPNKKVVSTASKSGPARIQSTTRQMYQDYLGNKAKDVEGIKWLDVVRELYQDAWKRAHNAALPETVEKYRNDLMVAKCYSVMGVKPPK